MERKSIEDYLIDLINQKYAKRVFSMLTTEHEKKFLDLGENPNYREYEWMIQRALEIHRQLNVNEEEIGDNDAKETANTV